MILERGPCPYHCTYLPTTTVSPATCLCYHPIQPLLLPQSRPLPLRLSVSLPLPLSLLLPLVMPTPLPTPLSQPSPLPGDVAACFQPLRLSLRQHTQIQPHYHHNPPTPHPHSPTPPTPIHQFPYLPITVIKLEVCSI